MSGWLYVSDLMPTQLKKKNKKNYPLSLDRKQEMWKMGGGKGVGMGRDEEARTTLRENKCARWK